MTGNQPVYDFKQLVTTADLFRNLGFSIAMDDLGEGFSRLRLWSELRPGYGKIDRHFIHGVSQDPVKSQLLRSLLEIAAKTGAKVVAEGIELEADLAVIMDMGMHLGQGYLIGRPVPIPHEGVSPEIRALVRKGSRSSPRTARITEGRPTAARLMVAVLPLAPSVPNWKVARRFALERELQSIPVVKDGVPVGLINRYTFTDLMARPFTPELYGKRPCEVLMDRAFLVVDHRISLPELSKLIVESDPRNILHGFILTRDGQYAGLGSGHDLMREITQMQIHAARYANPLTGLPGNVPINEDPDDLLQLEQPFTVCYCDLDHFKPYNDVNGYGRGDEVIRWTGNLIEGICEPILDFVGHIGGDDFLIVFRSPDWERRCRDLPAEFEKSKGQFFSQEEQASSGYTSEDRKKHMVKHPLFSLSIGALRVLPGAFPSNHEVAAAVSLAKKEAKRIEGSSLFIERRNTPGNLEGPVQDDRT